MSCISNKNLHMEENGPKIGLNDKTSNKNEEALPELELKEIKKSEKPINKEMDETREVECVVPWNNYTIVTLKNSNKISFFDEKVKKLEDFKEPLNRKEVSITWVDKIFREKIIKKQYISRNSSNYNKEYNLFIDEVPSNIRPFAELALKKAENTNSRDHYFELSTTYDKFTIPTSRISILDKYIIFSGKEGIYFTLKTENENGIVQAPRNWKRIEAYDEIPVELEQCIKKAVREQENYKQLNEKYSVLITDVGINIEKNEEAESSAPVFSDRLPSVDKNIITDPSNKDIIYYCSSSNPKDIVKLDLSKEPSTWAPVTAEFPKKYEEINNLQLDPSGNFFLFYSKEDLVIITKDTLQEVKRVPKLTQVNFDNEGNIRAVDKDGFLVILEPNFKVLEEEINKRKISKIASGVNFSDIFDSKIQKQKEEKSMDKFDEDISEYLKNKTQ